MRRRARLGNGLPTRGMAQPPLSDRGLNAVDESARSRLRSTALARAARPRSNTRTADGAGNDRWRSAEILLKKELVKEGGVLMLHSNEPGQHHGEIENYSRPPKRAQNDIPLAAQESKRGDDEKSEKRRDRPFGERGQPGERSRCRRARTWNWFRTRHTNRAIR